MRALVTGSSGFIGRAFTRYLESHGWSVLAVDTAEGWDCRDAFGYLATGFDLLVHAAAVIGSRQERERPSCECRCRPASSRVRPSLPDAPAHRGGERKRLRLRLLIPGVRAASLHVPVLHMFVFAVAERVILKRGCIECRFGFGGYRDYRRTMGRNRGTFGYRPSLRLGMR
jgi:hypothetical protein